MRRVRAFVVLLLLTGCSHSAVVVSNARPVTPTGGIYVNAAGSVGAALLVGMAAVAAAAELSNPQPTPGMQAEREVLEQDCTQPVDFAGNLSANLRCR
jgi:hypothetical protein